MIHLHIQCRAPDDTILHATMTMVSEAKAQSFLYDTFMAGMIALKGDMVQGQTGERPLAVFVPVERVLMITMWPGAASTDEVPE